MENPVLKRLRETSTTKKQNSGTDTRATTNPVILGLRGEYNKPKSYITPKDDTAKKDDEKKASAPEGKFNGWKYFGNLGRTFVNGLASLAATGAWAEDQVTAVVDTIFQGAGTQGSGFFNALYHGRPDWKFLGENGLVGIKQEQEYLAQQRAEEVAKIDTGNEKADKLLRGVASFGGDTAQALGGAVPMAAEALVSGGASMADDLFKAGSNIIGKTGVLDDISKPFREMLTSRNYWTAFATEVGQDYQEALAEGASPSEASNYAVATALLNSAIEIGGGIQNAPNGFSVKQLLRSAAEEGFEEVEQGPVGRLMKNVVLGKNAPLFSLTDEAAVVNPITAAKEFAGGFVVGGLLSGGQAAVASAARGLAGPQMTQEAVQRELGADTQSSAAPLSEAAAGKELVKMTAAAKTGEYAEALVTSYNEGQDADAYITEMDKVYIAGLNNAPMERVETSTLTDQQKRYVYNIGNKEYVLEKAKGDLTNEEVYLRGGSERLDGTSAGGAVRGMEEGAGRAAQWKAQAVQSADAGAGTLSYGEEVTVASLGIAGGSTIAKVRKVTGGSTPELAKAQAMADAHGLQLIAFGGGNLVINQEEARACIIGNRMFVRVDHQAYTSAQLTRHEVTHHRIDSGEIDPKAVRAEMEATHTAEAMKYVDELYADAYAGTGLSPDEIWVEVVCDSQGDMNIFAKTDEGDRVGEFLTETKKAADTTAKKTNPIRGPTEAKMSRETNFTEDKYFARQIDRFENLTEGGYITVGEISEGSPLNKVGIPSGKLYFDVSKVLKELRDRSDPISKADMKKIPTLLNNPVVITEFVDQYGNPSANVYGWMFVSNSPVVVGVVVTKTARGVVVNKVRTVHPRRNYSADMSDDKILYLSENKKETKRWFQALGKQTLPLGGTKFGFIRSLAQNGNSVKPSEIEPAGVQYDAETKSVAPSHLSRETWVQSSYMTDREKAAKSIAKTLGVTEKQAKAYIDDINSVAKLIADDRVRLDYEPNMDAGATVLKPNSEYKYTVDMSTLCAKRLLFTGTFDAIQKALPNTALDSEDIVLLRKMMQDKGLEVACGICYVESTRREIGRITQEFIERYKAAQKSGGVITRINSGGKEVPLTVKGRTFKADKNYTPNLGELNTTDIDLVKRDHREVYDAYLAFMNARGQAKPKLLETRAEYKGEILKHFKAKSAVNSRNEHGGLRLQSFSDFEVPHMIDMMQVVMDMSQVGLKSQAYTKVPAFAAVFGDTGVKINLSLIAKDSGLDSKGNLIFDDVEGIDHKEAFRLRGKYSKNVGTILVGKNDAHIIAALADPRIDFVIPFHKSSWKESLYDALGLTGYEDYTDTQNEKPLDKERKISNFDPSEYWDFTKSGDENAQVYLEKCRADGRIPKFPQFQSYAGYWKLLIDFKMYDNNGVGSPQTVVRPQFNMAEARRVLKEYEGGHRSFPVAQDVVDEFVKQYKKQGAKFSREVYAPTFYSQMGKVVEESKQAKFGAASVVNFLKGKGVKNEEIKWSGIEEWLEGKKSVTKEELLQFINSNQLQISEWQTVDFRNATYIEEESGVAYTYDEFREQARSLAKEEGLDPDQVTVDYYSGEDEDSITAYAGYGATELMTAYREFQNQPRWSDYKLDGGSNYREILFMLPNSDYTNNAMRDHWGGDTAGVLAHARVQDFYSADGRMLFIEEIQSDWHNRGQKFGYRKAGEKTAEQLRKESDAAYSVFYETVEKMVEDNANWEDEDAVYYAHPVAVAEMFDGDESHFDRFKFTEEQKKNIRAMVAAEAARREAKKSAPSDGAAPDAPFRDTYHEFVLKSLLRKAAEGDYDYLAWTTGEMQEERWSSNYAEGYRIEYDQDMPKFLNKYGKKWGAKVEKIQLKSSGGDTSFVTDDGSKYKTYGSAWRAIAESVGLKPYDTTVEKNGDVATVYNSFSGAEIGTISLVSEPVVVWSIPVTEAMKQSVLYEGQPMYSRELDQEKVDKAWQNFIDKYGEIPAGENPFRQVRVPKKTGENENVSQTIRTVMEARATPDEAIPTIKKMVADGDFSYESITDEASLDRAMAEVKTRGWETALKDWTASVRAGNVSKDNTAMGWALYNNAANSGNINQAVEILQDIAQHQRSAAQALQATRILKRLSPDGQLYGVTRSVQNLQEELIARYGKKAPDLKINETLAQKVLTAGTQEARDEAMKEIYRDIGRQMPSSFVDKWNAWRYLAMLGNLRTHVRNVVGNAGFAPVVGVKNLLAGGIEAAVSKASGGKIDRTKAVVGLAKKDRELLAAAWDDFKNVQDSAAGGGKYSEFANANKHIEEGRKIFKSKALEAARRGNSKLLDVEDMWFSQPHYASALAQYCKARGISAAQIEKGTPAARKARAYAIEEAKKATYRDTNALSSFLSKRFNESGDTKSVAKAANTLVAGILPFRKTPANILARGVEYSPIGLANGIKKAVWDVQRGKSTAAEAIDNISAGLTGTGLLALGLYLAAQGLVRGAGGGDEKERKFEELMGHQAYALELPNGTSIMLDWLAPEALPFFVGVNLYEQTRGEFGDMKMDDALSAIGRVTEPMLEMSCLQSLNSLLDAVGYASEEGLGVVAADAATSYLTQGLPTLLGQLERSTEKSRMTTYTDKNKWLSTDLQYTLGRATARIPLLEYGQIPYIDAWGREEDSGSAAARVFNNFINPAYTSTVEEDYLSDELLRLYQSTGESVLPSRASKYFNVDGERKDLTAGEYVQYATVKGQTAYDMLYEIANDKVYKQLGDMDKVGVVKDVYELANAMAKTEVSSYKPDGWVAKALDGEASGVSAADYILYRAALDKVNADGGNPTNAEQEEAIRAMGLGDEANHYLWMAYHTSDKNEPNW